MANKIDLINMALEDLKERLKEDSTRLTQLKFNHAVTPLEDVNVLKNLKKDIARYKTELSSQLPVNSKSDNRYGKKSQKKPSRYSYLR